VPGRIRDEDLQLVRARSPIAEVVGEYLQLRSAGGGSLKGLCPFHDEKTPSFNVTPARGLWYCFSCAEGGDVIAFVRKIDNLGFTEAVERLAARAGIELRYEQGGPVPGQEQSKRRRLIEAHRAAAEFYAENLLGAQAGIATGFLSSRGFELADAQRFGVGYAPDDWEVTTRHLRGRGFTEEELLSAGLAGRGRHGLVDRFRGRLIWPIRDLAGDVIAFGARKLADDDNGPKYLNSPETPIFKKSSVLYGADLAKRDIAQRRQAVIVEGYTDVMACHLAGVATAVATCGTSFGESHVKILRRLLLDTDLRPSEFIFTFDGDLPGQRAALRAFGMEHTLITQTYVAVQPSGMDPCDLRVKEGDAAVRDLVANRVPLYEFAVRDAVREFDLESAEGRVAALDRAAEIVARIKDPALRKVYAVKVDRWLGLLDEDLVLRRIGAHIPKEAGHLAGPVGRRAAPRSDLSPSGASDPQVPGQRDGQRGQFAAESRQDPAVNLERQVLKLAIQRPALLGPAFDGLGADVFTAPAHQAVRELIVGCGGVGAAGPAREWVDRLLEAAPHDNARMFLTRLAVEPLEVPGVSGEPDAHFADEALCRVEELAVSRRIAVVKSRLQRMNPLTEEAGYNHMFGDLVALEQRRKLLIERAGGL
jgi:DNA primase